MFFLFHWVSINPPPPWKWYHWYDERKNEKKKRCVKWLQIKELHISKSISSNIKHFISQQKKKAEKNLETGLFSRRIFFNTCSYFLNEGLCGAFFYFLWIDPLFYWIGDPEVQYLYQFFEFYLFYTAIFMSWFILMIKYDE